MKDKEQDGFDSGRGSSSNPIQLPEIIVYGKKPLPWYRRAINGVAKFVNDEILLNKNNIRVKNARKAPKAMDAIQEGGNIAGAIVAAPFAAYAAVQAAPVVMPALRVAGQAMTPSTWIGGGMQAAGYQAPNWLLNGADLALSAHFANEAGKDIDKNGLTWKTGFNALMALSPLTRETEAIEGVANTLRRPTQAVNSVVDDFRAARNSVSSPEAVLAREFGRSVKDTQLINVPIEHVSTKGMTEGAGLNASSSTDVGFHFSPAGSRTTTNIQQATGAPFVRTGTWTYSNNTRPVFALDKGNWTYDFNPELYQGLSPGSTPAENAIALSQRSPNYTYVNNFEGQGGRSYMTTEPNFWVQLSKNEVPKIQEERLRVKPKSGISTEIETLDQYLQNFTQINDRMYHGGIGDNTFYVTKTDQGYKLRSSDKNGEFVTDERFSSFQDLLKFLENQHEDFLKTLSPLQRTAYLERPVAWNSKAKGSNYREGNEAGSSTQFRRDVKAQIQSDIDDFYLSPEYKERFLSKDFGSTFYPELEQSLREVNSITHPSSYNGLSFSEGHSAESVSGYNTLGINTNYVRSTEGLENTITHEFGHGMYRPWLVKTNDPLYFIMKTNQNLTKDALSNLNPGIPVDDYTKYISGHDELRQRIIPYVKRSFQEGLTPEETYNIIIDNDLKNTFRKDYIIKLIGGMLGISPIIARNDQQN